MGVVLAGVALVIVPVAAPAWRINNVVSSVDLAAGRTRSQWHLLGIPLTNTVREGAVTGLYREYVGEPPEPNWCVLPEVFASQWLTDQPGHEFPGLEQLLASPQLSREAKRVVLLNFFSLMSSHPRRLRPGWYLAQVHHELRLAADAGVALDLARLAPED
jgi:hypothetical protein